MRDLLTERAEAHADRAWPLLSFAALVFVGYAISRHLDWQDAVAITLVLRFIIVAIYRRPP